MRTGKFIAGTVLALAGLTACGAPAVTDAGYIHHHQQVVMPQRHYPVPVRHSPTPTPMPTRSTPSPTTPPTAPPTATPTGTATAPAPGIPSAPLPAALAGKKAITGDSFSPSVLSAPPWSTPSNAPGNCLTPNTSAHLNAAGLAEIDTTGADGDCVSIQSPGLLPTRPGTVWEWKGTFSSFQDWPAFWGYGPNWPGQGEIDAVEGGPGVSGVTWHQAGNYTIGPDPWDNQRVPLAGSPDIAAGVLTTVDISFTTTGVDVYYQGKLYVHIPESVTTSGNDPMYATISEGSCNAEGANVCNGGHAPAGSVTTQYLVLYA